MKNTINRLILITITLIALLCMAFLVVISYLIPSINIKLIGIVLVFTMAILAICIIFIMLVSKHISRTLGALSQTIESIIDDHPTDIFSTIEDTMLSKLQSQVLKLSGILKSHSIKQKEEKEAITGLITDISHQLKTPLTNLNMYNSLLLDQDLDHNTKIEFNKNMKNQLKKLNWLMESLIKMSRLETGIIELNAAKQPISQTVLQAIFMISKKAEEKGINIIYNGEDISLFHDSKWTEEAVFNILDNAVKYSAKDTEISVSIIKYELFCRINIQDAGDGIIEPDINKIFTRFYRGKNASNIDGVGIGLFLARKIISMQGGYIKVKSVLGKGSIFSICLPAEESKDP